MIQFRFIAYAVALVCCEFWWMAPEARATSNYTYRAGEYVTVNGGRSPDGKYAVATHGEGDLGYDNFHVYLMDGATGKKIGPFEEVAKDPLDSGADAYYAKWSADSTQVAITYREDRHKAVEIVYLIKKGRAYRVSGPTEVAGLPQS